MKHAFMLLLALSCSSLLFSQNSFPGTGNVGIGTTSPASSLSVKGRVGIRADATPTLPTEALRVEGAVTSEENVFNVTNLVDQDFLVRLTAPGAALNTRHALIGPSVSTRLSLGVGISGGNEYLSITNGGNVGIGSTSPDGFQVNTSMSQESSKGINNVRIGVMGGSPRIMFDANGYTPFEIDNYSGAFRIFSPGSVKLQVNSNGNVGIGTTNPISKLTVSLENSNNWNGNLNALRVVSPDNGYYMDLKTYIVSSGNVGYLFSANGYRGMAMTTDGKIGIGTLHPDEWLTVNGTIHGTEVKVDVSVPGPDYVFEKEYALPSIESVKTYIDQNKHLPEVPSAKEMEANGINLSEMNMLLLKKVEELTLYMIEQNKMMKYQNEIVQKQSDRILQLEKIIKN